DTRVDAVDAEHFAGEVKAGDLHLALGINEVGLEEARADDVDTLEGLPGLDHVLASARATLHALRRTVRRVLVEGRALRTARTELAWALARVLTEHEHFVVVAHGAVSLVLCRCPALLFDVSEL